MAKATKWTTFILTFGSKTDFLKANISKRVWETCPQNFTMFFTHLKSLKNGLITFGGVFFFGIVFGSTYCERVGFELGILFLPDCRPRRHGHQFILCIFHKLIEVLLHPKVAKAELYSKGDYHSEWLELTYYIEALGKYLITFV